MTVTKQFLAYTIFPLGIGCCIYFGCRPSTLILNSWLHKFQLEPLKMDNILLRQICNSLPFSLWAIAFTNTMFTIWNNQINRESVYWISFSLLISPMTELLQIFKIVPGTFDIYDFLFLIVTISAFIFCIKPKLKLSL